MSGPGKASPSSPEYQAWRAPECPFAIEWSAPVMDEIRIAAMEGLFSIPHGGAEIGGLLLGTRNAGVVRILAARPLACEHAMGPSFTLSSNDCAGLAAALLEGAQAPDREPVGWYHSHTRSEIHLSGPDLEIHDRYFPGPLDVALVVRPHAMLPVRGAFFFRAADGSIQGDAGNSEFVLPAAPRIPLPEPVPAETVVPLPSRRRKPVRWAATVMGMVLGMAVGLILLCQKDWTHVFAADRSPSVSLRTYDLGGQLQIRWDWAANPIRSAQAGTLEIADGAALTKIALEPQLLREGTVSYARIGNRVDVRLTLREPAGKIYSEFSRFIGQPGGPDRDAMLRGEVHALAGRTRELEQAVAGLRGLIRRDGERRGPDVKAQPAR